MPRRWAKVTQSPNCSGNRCSYCGLPGFHRPKSTRPEKFTCTQCHGHAAQGHGHRDHFDAKRFEVGGLAHATAFGLAEESKRRDTTRNRVSMPIMRNMALVNSTMPAKPCKALPCFITEVKSDEGEGTAPDHVGHE